ncbi:VaFE repeat-containing surface-anchored protein [Mordavella massiliensis]|uniref:VaFE repeat-containing surface-anchored protein n=1 Tax=Mordavella massiliensis TaxID=1871024 RepID=A0A939BD46_9CLOT|nr:VaFE repeat-containing surface-anchored protein [Mordavella massiliensis]MBM6827517.1 VaFE repeat-containing surface-anchored protein [Mordavella massiliensis]
MRKKITTTAKRLFAFILTAVITVGTLAANQLPVHAADGTLNFHAGDLISYGDYYTSRMTVDGSNTAYCVQPMMKTPESGTYSYDLLSSGSALRKALYYLPGGYGYEKENIQSQYLSGWSETNCYVIGHLTASYVYADYDAGSGAFYGAPQNYIDKAVEIANAIKNLPNPPSSFRAFIIPSSSSQTVAGSWYEKPYGWIEIQKSSANAGVSNGNGNYSLKGAQYGIYQGESLIETLVTDANGYAKSGELEEGNYTVKEISASKGYIVDTQAHNVTVSSDATSTAEVTEIPINNPIDLVLQKLDKELEASTPQGAASLAGAEFTVKFYTQQSDADPAADGAKPVRTWVLKTGSDGALKFTEDALVSGDNFYYTSDGSTICLPLGTVTVQETKAPAGYFVNDTIFVQKISGTSESETINVYQSSEVPEQIYRGGVQIQKRDLETGEAAAQGNATLEGAEFTIITLNENPVIVNGETYENGEAVLTLTTDENGLASTAADTLPYGHYRVDETKAPEGYLNEGRISLEFDITEDGKIVELTAEDQSISNQVIRGDLELVKVSDGDLSRLAGVPFTITSKTTGESHTIVTDRNGYASTSAEWNKHTSNTNRGETAEDGIWFGSSDPDDSKGALIYDTYTVEEQRCEANEGRNLLSFDVEVYRDSVTIDLGTLTNDKVEIATTALDKESGSQMAKPDDKVTIVDTVEFEGLKKGVEYKVIGTLMNKETGEALEINGEPITSETTFTAKKSTGSAEVEFTFDATGLEGTTVVCFEELWQEDLKLAVHADISDQDQSIYFPSVGTQVKDSETGAQIAHADEEVTLIDTVSYANVQPGEELTLQGVLMDKETGEELLIDGEPITAETTFTPEESASTVDVEFTFNASEVSGKTLVVFESLLYKGEEIARHKDLDSPEQTLVLPSVNTTATNPDTGSQIGLTQEEASIQDVAEYTNLIPGETFTIRGVLMDQETEEEFLINEQPVTAEAEFTPEESSGSVELSFHFDASALSGKTLVVYEEILYKDQVVASHRQIDSPSQSIYYPEIGTTASDADDGDQEALADEEVTIKDEIAYKNLVPGLTFRAEGVLMDKETGEQLLIDDQPVTSEVEFTPEESSGTVEVSFTFNGSNLAGKTLVVFEKLYLISGDSEIPVASHEDLESTEQSVLLSENPPEVPEEDTPDVSAPVKTGDETNLMLYLIIGGVAILVLAGTGGYLLYKRRHNNKNS